MKIKETIPDVGIIVGRFQVPDLHEAHKNLIQSVIDRHQKVIIFLGVSPVHDSRDPLDFDTRKKMIEEVFPNVIISYITDVPCNVDWSIKLDSQIEGLLNPRQTCILYGGRSSFINAYLGKFPTAELVQEHWVSGTEMRNMVRNTTMGSRDFRHGAIWAHWNRFPTVFTTVDIAVLKASDEGPMLLIGRKNIDGNKWRFPGGFSDPKDVTFEESAMRELKEEVPKGMFKTIQISNYIGSINIDDWRYRNKEDCIRTLFYYTIHLAGEVEPGDDLDEVKWVLISTFDTSILVPNHRVLFNILLEKVPLTKILNENKLNQKKED